MTDLVVSVIALAAFVTFLACAVMAVRRLTRIRDDTAKIERHLIELRHPEIPFPPLPADQIVHRDAASGGLLTLRADGRWQRWSQKVAAWEIVE